MKKGNIERVERITYQLEMGIDFQANDLEDDVITGGALKHLSKDFDFYKLNIGRLVWSGHFDKETRTILVKVEKELFI